MMLIVKEIQKIYTKLNFEIQDIFSEDEEINLIVNNYELLTIKEQEIIRLLNQNIETILYSRYFWFSLYLRKYNEKIGYDASIEQQQFKLIEEIDERSKVGVDWKLVQEIEVLIKNTNY